MTGKELLYVEDALGHEEYFQTRCDEIAAQISDSDLRETTEKIKRQHQQIFSSFINLLN